MLFERVVSMGLPKKGDSSAEFKKVRERPCQYVEEEHSRQRNSQCKGPEAQQRYVQGIGTWLKQSE